MKLNPPTAGWDRRASRPRPHRLLARAPTARRDGADPITIGISLPLTGDFSEPGKGVQRGYEAWAAT